MTHIAAVTVLGTGVLGSQIAYQTAYSRLDVVAYDINEKALTVAKKRFTRLAATYKEQIKGAAEGRADAALKRITLQTDLGRAVAEADLVIEAIPENVELKRDIYRKIGHLAPQKTIFATNTSTLLPSDLMESTGRPERFLALHFANQIWIHNTAEVMGTSKTDPDVYRTIVDFASEIGMVPIELKKEHPRYVLNSSSDVMARRCARAARGWGRRAGHRRQDMANRYRRAAGSVPNPRHGRVEHRLQHRRGGE